MCIPLRLHLTAVSLLGPHLTDANHPPERYKVQFTVSRETHDKLRRVQDLMRHTIPDGDPAAIFDRALTLLLTDLSKAKCGATEHPKRRRAGRSRSRHIPAEVKRDVWRRDEGRCAFDGEHGRCGETGFLEFHHVVPYADGGEPSVGNIQLRCRTHNQYEAEQWCGAWAVPQVRETRAHFVAGSPPRSGPSCQIRSSPDRNALMRFS